MFETEGAATGAQAPQIQKATKLFITTSEILLNNLFSMFPPMLEIGSSHLLGGLLICFRFKI
jgi:hypothetical protein